MATYSLTDALYSQTTKTKLATTSKYERLPPPPAPPDPASSSLPLPTLAGPSPSQQALLQSMATADQNYDQRRHYYHPQQQQMKSSSLIRQGRVNSVSTPGGVGDGTGSAALPSDRRKLTAIALTTTTTSATTTTTVSSSGHQGANEKDAKMLNNVAALTGAYQFWPPKQPPKPDALGINLLAAEPGMTAAYIQRQRILTLAAASVANIPSQTTVSQNSISCTSDEINRYSPKANPRRQHPANNMDNSIIQCGGGIVKLPLALNGWSSSSSSSGPSERNLQVSNNDQPLDLTSVKKKRYADPTTNDDSPLDLSTKKRKLEDVFSAERQKHGLNADHYVNFLYSRPEATRTDGMVTGAGHELSARIGLQPQPNDLYQQASGRIRPLGQRTPETKGRHTQNSRPKPITVSRAPFSTGSSYQLFENRTEMNSLTGEVPVIRHNTMMTNLDFVSRGTTQSGSFSSASSSFSSPASSSSYSLASLKSGSNISSFNRDAVGLDVLTNPFAIQQRALALHQQQHLQQQQLQQQQVLLQQQQQLQQQQHQQQLKRQQQHMVSSYPTTQRETIIPRTVVTETKIAPTLNESNELLKVSEINRQKPASTGRMPALELGPPGYGEVKPPAIVIASLQQQPQQSAQSSQDLSIGAIKRAQPAVGLVSGREVTSEQKMNILAGVFGAPITNVLVSTPTHPVRPNSKGNCAKANNSRTDNLQPLVHDATGGANIVNLKNQTMDCLPPIRDAAVQQPTSASRGVDPSFLDSMTKATDLQTWNKTEDKQRVKLEMSFQVKEDSKIQSIETIPLEALMKPIQANESNASIASGRNIYCQPNYQRIENHLPGSSSSQNSSFGGIATSMAMVDVGDVNKIDFDRKIGELQATLPEAEAHKVSIGQNMASDVGADSKWSSTATVAVRPTDSEKNHLTDQQRNPIYVVREGREEISDRSPSERNYLISDSKIREKQSPAACQFSGTMENFIVKEIDFSSTFKKSIPFSAGTTTVDSRPQEIKDQDPAKRQKNCCETCKQKGKDEVDSSVVQLNSFSKILPCRDCDARDLCGVHSQTTPPLYKVGQGDMISRICRQGTRPVANVQPFMKEPLDVKPARETPTNLEEDSAKTAFGKLSLATTKDMNRKSVGVAAAAATGGLKEHQTLNWVSSNTPHHMEFVKFISMSMESKSEDLAKSSPFRTPDAKLEDQLESEAKGAGRNKVRRQLLMNMDAAESKGGQKKVSADSRREGVGTLSEPTKKTPVEYIDEDNTEEMEPVRKKQKSGPSGTETKEDLDRSFPNENEALYESSALYQTMKALDRKQAEVRLKSSLLTDRREATRWISDWTLRNDNRPSCANAAAIFTTSEDKTLDETTKMTATIPEKKGKKKQKKMNHMTDDERKPADKTHVSSSSTLCNSTPTVSPLSNSQCPPHHNPATDSKEADKESKILIATTLEPEAQPRGALDERSALSSPESVKRKCKRKRRTADFEDAATEESADSELPEFNDAHSNLELLEATLTTPASLSISTDLPSNLKHRRRRPVINLSDSLTDSAGVKDQAANGARSKRSDLDDTVAVADSEGLQVPQLPRSEESARRRRGTTTRKGGIVRNARCSLAYDKNSAYEAELKQEAERRLLRRGQRGGAGPRSAARLQPRTSLTPPDSRRTDNVEEGMLTTLEQGPSSSSASSSHESGQRQNDYDDDESTCDFFAADDYDDDDDEDDDADDRSSITSYPCLKGSQGRKSIRKMFQYPEVFGRRRARGGLRGRARPGRMETTMMTEAWDKKEEPDTSTPNHRVTVESVRNGAEFGVPSTQPATTMASSSSSSSLSSSSSVRGKVKAKVRATPSGRRTSRINPRGGQDGCGPVTSDNQSSSAALGRDTSETRLHQVTRLGYEELVSYYLTTGIIHANVQDNSGVTPIHNSCCHGYLNITRLLLDHGAQPNSKALDGTRPLHLAVANDHVEIVRLLLSYGADVTMTNGSGRSPLQLAKTRHMKQLIKGFTSDITGIRGKEIPWEFPASYENGGVCDILADAPPDEQNDATEVIFDLGNETWLPVHRFVPDSRKGPRNFHSVAEMCQDVKVEDFLLLNGDLTYVHVSSDTRANLRSSSAAAVTSNDVTTSGSTSSIHASGSCSSTQTRIPSFQEKTLFYAEERCAYVEIDGNLKGLLDVAVHRIGLFANRKSSNHDQDCHLAKTAESVDAEHTSAAKILGASSDTSSCKTDICSTDSDTSYLPQFPVEIRCDVRSKDAERTSNTVVGLPSENVSTSHGNDDHSKEEDFMNLNSASQHLSRHFPPHPMHPTSSYLLPSSPLFPGNAGKTPDNTPFKGVELCDTSDQSQKDLKNSIKPDRLKEVMENRPNGIRRDGNGARTRAERENAFSKTEDPIQDNKTMTFSKVTLKKCSPIDAASESTEKVDLPSSTSNSFPVAICVRQDGDEFGGSSGRSSVSASLPGQAVAPTPCYQRQSAAALVVPTMCRRRNGPREAHLDVASKLRSVTAAGSEVTATPSSSNTTSTQASESLIPVLEKHGSDDEELQPVVHDVDQSGEIYDEDREMPQLTLYA